MLKLATFRGVTDEGEPLVRLFQPGDLIKTAGEMMPQIRNWMASYQPDPNKIAVLVNALGASEYWGQNVNGDIFPEKALLHDCSKHSDAHPYDDFTGKIIPPYGAWTFLQAHPFVHHRNKDPNRAFGNVVLWAWNPKMHRVELIILLDKQLAMQHGAQHVIDRILAGEFPDVSMGCRVPYDICSICGHKSKTRKDYCNCVKLIGMGKVLDDGRKIGVINTYPRFFDISFVFIGADKTAKVMCKLGSEMVPQSVLDAEMLYGIDEDDGQLVKAASIQVPDNLIFMKQSQTNVTTGAGTGGVDLVADDIAKGPPEPKPANLLLSKEDKQENEERRAIADGALKTNADVNETDEFPAPLYPYNSGAQSKTAADGMSELWSKCKNMRIGPPPKPNRKEYPFTGTIDFRGLMIHVENKPGTIREGKGWKTHMRMAYGEFLGTLGVDKDKLDVYVGPYRNAPNVYIIHQNHVRGPRAGKYDEDKVMVGFESAEQAKQAYLAHYDSDKYFRSITTMAFPLFKRAIMKKEVHGEKVASDLNEMEKKAIDLKLEDLFTTSKEAERRERTWKHSDGKVTKAIGSGLGSSEMAKEAARIPDWESWTPEQQEAHRVKIRALNKKMRARTEEVRARLIAEGKPIPTIHDLFPGLKTKEAAGVTSLSGAKARFRRKMKRITKAKTASFEERKAQCVEKSAGFEVGRSPLTPYGQKLIKEYTRKKKMKSWDDLDVYDAAQEHWKRTGKDIPDEKLFKKASPLEPLELLKVSNNPKTATQLKWADIVKEIGPSKAVGKVSPLLSDNEPNLPTGILNELGNGGLERGLSTTSMAGMVLKPEEFQRACLSSMGKQDLADKMDEAGAVFKPTEGEEAPCPALGGEHMGMDILKKILPHLGDKSYFGPPVRARIIRITIVSPSPKKDLTQVDSPLLSKVSAAYNWYRREQMKLAGEALEVVPKIPELHAAVHGMESEDLFGKEAAEVNPKTMAVILGAVPLTLMYSAHLRGKQREGKDLGMLKNMIADHPWLSTLATAGALRSIMATPQAQQAVEEIAQAVKNIATGTSTKPPIVV